MADVIKAIIARIDTTSNWTTLNPVPGNGEQCIEVLGKGLFKLKVGDGITPWIALKYETLDDGFSKFKVLLDKEIKERKEADQRLEIALVDGLAQKIDHFEVLPEPSEENFKNVVQYIGETNQEFTHNYFYECFHDYRPSTLYIQSSDELLHALIDKNIFEENTKLNKDTTLEFIYVIEDDPEESDESGEAYGYWVLNGRKVDDISFFGITLSGFVREGDILTVTYKIADVRYYWERVSVQPETDLTPVWKKFAEVDQEIESLAEGKVDKTHENMKIYGTDEHGNQHLYDKEDFGKVDDVQINGTSIVTDKIANIVVDSEVTEDSQNLVTSGGVFDAITEATPTYTAEEPATVDVGGFSIGDQPTNMSFVDFADTLLHKYVKPTISHTISPNTITYQLGTTKDITMSATVTRKAASKYPLTSLTFYDNDVQKEKITDGIDVKTGTWSYKFTGVGTTTNTRYYTERLKATVKDSYGSSVDTYTDIVFVAPTFYGKVKVPDEYDDTPAHVETYLQTNIETILSNLTKNPTTNSIIDNSCKLTKEHYIFVTPFIWTGTKKIYDTITNIDYTNSTSMFTYNHTENGVTTKYNVYYLTDYTGNDDNFIFRLTVSVTKG